MRRSSAGRARIRAWRDGRRPPSAQLAAPPPAPAHARDVYVYFDNDIKVHAPYDALSLAAKVDDDERSMKKRGVKPQQQAHALSR